MSDFGKTFQHNILHPEILVFGIALLHILIRCFEDLFKAATKKISKTSDIPVKEVKENLQQEFWEELGLRVFYPEVGGGTSNTGNTSRVVFKKAAESARILQVSEELITGTQNLIGKISSQESIPNSDDFERDAFKVWELYNQELGSFKSMCPTYHRLVSHGAAYLKFCERIGVPPGYLSESSIESLNSLNRSVRLNHTRKAGPALQNIDSFNYMLCNSSPYINYVHK